MKPNESERKIAWPLNINADDLHERAALNAATAQRGDYVSISVNHATGALMQLDANERSTDPRELLAVLGRKVASAQGSTGTDLESAARDILASAKRLLETVIGRRINA